jgi:hypothetical protein
LAWEKLEKKYDPVSALSLVKTERLFRESKLGKDEDPDTWVTNLEDLRLKSEVMGSFMTDDQFMVQVLNSLTNDYEFQMILLEKRIKPVNFWWIKGRVEPKIWNTFNENWNG